MYKLNIWSYLLLNSYNYLFVKNLISFYSYHFSPYKKNSYAKYKYINNKQAKYYAEQYYNAHLIQIIKIKYKKNQIILKIITSTNENIKFQLLTCNLQIKIKDSIIISKYM